MDMRNFIDGFDGLKTLVKLLDIDVKFEMANEVQNIRNNSETDTSEILLGS